MNVMVRYTKNTPVGYFSLRPPSISINVLLCCVLSDNCYYLFPEAVFVSSLCDFPQAMEIFLENNTTIAHT